MASTNPVKQRHEPFGRPTKYHAGIVDQVNDLAQEGHTHTQIARKLGIARQTLYTWADEHPNLMDAIKRSRDGVVEKLESALINQAEGEVTGNATAGIFMLKNLAPDLYRDRHDHHFEAKDGVVINFLGYDEDEDDAIDGEFEEV